MHSPRFFGSTAPRQTRSTAPRLPISSNGFTSMADAVHAGIEGAKRVAHPANASEILARKAVVKHACSLCNEECKDPLPLSSEPGSLLEFGIAILNTHDSTEKARGTLLAWKLWREGKLRLTPEENEGEWANSHPPPDWPARPLHLKSLPPKDMPKPVAGNFPANRLRLVHSQAHIESYAIDLSWDIMCRFAGRGVPGNPNQRLPREFFEDWLKVAVDEARHFEIWRRRLVDLDSSYGALPVHDALWESAEETSTDLFTRLAIVHMVHEARGLDASPRMMAQLASGGDKKSAALLAAIERDEETHVGAGMRWYLYVCGKAVPALDPIPTFHATVASKFRGSLRPPFNHKARLSVGMTTDWYLPMVEDRCRAGVRDEVAKLEAKALSQRAAGGRSESEDN